MQHQENDDPKLILRSEKINEVIFAVALTWGSQGHFGDVEIMKK
jgi:hypothetical protein